MKWKYFYDECLGLADANGVIIYNIEFWLAEWRKGLTPFQAFKLWLIKSKYI